MHWSADARERARYYLARWMHWSADARERPGGHVTVWPAGVRRGSGVLRRERAAPEAGRAWCPPKYGWRWLEVDP